jgi:hypothetical protein
MGEAGRRRDGKHDDFQAFQLIKRREEVGPRGGVKGT